MTIGPPATLLALSMMWIEGIDVGCSDEMVRSEATVRHPYADNLKTLLVIGVIVGHSIMASTGVGNQ